MVVESVLLLLLRKIKDAREFEVGVNYVEGRGYSSSIPKPIIELLGNPDSIKFVINKGNKIELVAGKNPHLILKSIKCK